jgi:hypothetical protein
LPYEILQTIFIGEKSTARGKLSKTVIQNLREEGRLVSCGEGREKLVHEMFSKYIPNSRH